MVSKAVLLVAVLASAVVGVPAAASAESVCDTAWGSAAKVAAPGATGEMTDLRAGRHDCYDRVVFDFRGTSEGFQVDYVSDVHEDGSGRLVPLRGGAKLRIVAHSPAYDESFNPTYTYANRDELVDVAGYRTFRQVAWAGSFEGQTMVGLGVRARLPFRAFTLTDKLVVDVAHTW